MEKVSTGGDNWLGDLASALVPPKKGAAPGDCMGLSAAGISGLSCDMVSNFVCEAPKPKILGEKEQELPFSDELLRMAESMKITYFFSYETSLSLIIPYPSDIKIRLYGCSDEIFCKDNAYSSTTKSSR
jgi:hypothetical protein